MSMMLAVVLSTITLKGYLGERLDAMIDNHVIKHDVDYITACFFEKTETKGWWQTEFWGKYMHAAAPLYTYCGSAKLGANLDRGIERIIASQEADGYIGNYPDELRLGEGWDVWGIKYTMMGLMFYYDLNRGNEKGAKALAACRKLCDYVIDGIGPNGKRGRELWQTGYWSGYASSSILEPVMWLYKRTQDRKYLDFAAFIVKGMEEPESGPRLIDLALKGISVADRNGYGNVAEVGGAYVCKHNRWKAYEMMSCYQGLLEYWEVAKVDKYFKATVMTAEDIIKTEINLAGGCSCLEAWYHGADKQHRPYSHIQETCVTTTWMRLCEKLLVLTGDPKWADELEKTFYNIYLASLNRAGSEFAAYTSLSGYRYAGHHHCAMHENCCNANGPRGFICFLNEFFTVKQDVATFNFYSSAVVSEKLANGGKVAFDMYSLYPRQNTARIVSHTQGVGEVPLRLRIPGWCEQTTVKLNGKQLEGVKRGEYFVIRNEWKYGDIIDVEFAMPVVAHACDYGAKQSFSAFSRTVMARPHAVAFTRGPILLARDSRFADGDLSEPLRPASIDEGQKMSGFRETMSEDGDIWMQFSAVLPLGDRTENPEGKLESEVKFCDYASAGNLWSRHNSYRTWFPVAYGPME